MRTNRTMDMTRGNILQHILIFTIPLFIGVIFQQLYNIMDMVIAGYLLEDKALAAIGATSTLYSLVIGFSNGMNNGFGIIWARRFGAKDEDGLRDAIGAALILNGFLIFGMTSLSVLGLKVFLRFMCVPQSIFERSYEYIMVILLGIGVTLLYNMEGGILRAVGNSRVPLYFVIVTSILNIFFNLVLVICFHMDVAGLALGTVIAQGISVLGCFFYITKNYPELKLSKKNFVLNKNLLGELFTTGLSMGLMSSIFSIGSVILQSGINKLGLVYVTAHTAARRIIEIFMQPFAALATAAATFVSQNFGAGEGKRIVDGIKTTCKVSFCWAVFSFVILYVFGEDIVFLLTHTKNKEVIDNAIMNIHININFFIFLGILVVLRSSLQGFGRKIVPLIASSIELGMKIFSKFFIVPRFGYVGASYTEPSTWLVCMVFLLLVALVLGKQFNTFLETK
ncbi:MATE family efflux transporter [[Clostridium] polysaccharolyticum]|uniref:Putative efflux protein, MATE family n=1 Tax=[Clostridium] polysaccharolyticum TaxID=29364 RepID=A0A1I0CIX2_9FIRM|nr:MATE family efflux transporter [[Clostridium] polysaccharolyticum]SET19590.1 putative efflux protein, MATE family [[Clostridium] polysaccharolyticum]